MTKKKETEQVPLIEGESKQEIKMETKEETVVEEKKESDPVLVQEEKKEESLVVVDEPEAPNMSEYWCTKSCQLRIEAEAGLLGTKEGTIRNYSPGDLILIVESEEEKLQKNYWEKL